MFFLLWLLTRLPFALQMRSGRLIGRMAYKLAQRRKHIAEVNIKLCFPELDSDAIRQLVVGNFESMGIAIFEMGMSWWSSNRRLEKLFSVEGMEHLEQALAGGRGAILLIGLGVTRTVVARRSRR